MKRFALLFIFLLPVAFQALAKDDLTVIVLGHKGGVHSEYYPPADMPEVYFDSNDFDLKSSWAHLFPSINQPINNLLLTI